MQLIECVPNFSCSEKRKIEQIVQAITSVDGVILLGYESDSDHNRSVVTFAGQLQTVCSAAFEGVKKAAEIIDLDDHQGVHPRMGACDVLPLIPLKGVSAEECIKYAEKLGERIGNKLQIPVFLYEKAARQPERRNLANIRNIGFEKLKSSKIEPDFGPNQIGKAGAIAVGVRNILIAYNINLNTPDLQIAKKIARSIRERDGGLKCVKALGLKLKSRNLAQVSMNLTNYKETGILEVFETVEKEASKYGVEILESEIIGFPPRDALPENYMERLKLRDFVEERILENTLKVFSNSLTATAYCKKGINIV